MAPSAARKMVFDTENDPTFYPVEEKLGEDIIQSEVVETFRPLLRDYVASLEMEAFVGKDQMMYYAQGDPTACVSPDVYVMPGKWVFEDYSRHGSWKKWECGVAPSFALEVMSEHNKKKKDDRKSPARHDALGTKELVVYDPYAEAGYRMRGRIRFRIFRRDSEGRLVLVRTTNDPIIHSEALGCYLRVVGQGGQQRLRIGTGPQGETLFPTRAEAEAQRANEEAQRANEEGRRANEEARRANEEGRRANEEARRANEEARRANEAESELARLRAELAALKASSR